MKKIVSILMVFALIFSLFSCNLTDNTEKPEKTVIRVGYMAGPTGMGMAKLICDNGGLDGESDKYSFKKYADTNAAKADLAAGNIDVICLPTNEAAMYYSKVDNNAKVLAINCLNSLFLLTSGNEKVTSLTELEGQTVYTCKNGTPRSVLQHIISELNLNVTISYEIDGKEIVTPQDLSACVVNGSIPNAVMPEPLVTSSLLTISKNANDSIVYTVDVDLNDEWSKFTDTPITMGCIIADGDFANYHKTELNDFLEEYKASVDYIGNVENLDSAVNYIVESGVMAAAPAAKKALINLGNSISYIDGLSMKDALVAFYSAIGVTLPSEDFYYEK